MSNLLQGVLELDGDCLYLVQKSIESRFPVLWPAGSRWDAQNKSVVSPGGAAMPIGGSAEGRGGYFYLSDLALLAGSAAWNLAVRCVDNGQIAVFANTGTGIGPQN